MWQNRLVLCPCSEYGTHEEHTVYMCVCVSMCVYVYMCVFLVLVLSTGFACVYVGVCVYICVYMYIYMGYVNMYSCVVSASLF